jgi:hypothetical protein
MDLFSRFKSVLSRPKRTSVMIRPIPTPEFPPLHAVNLTADDQTKLLKGYLEIKHTAQELTKTEFSLNCAHDYFQRTWIGSWRVRHYVWFFMFVVCCAINTQAVKTTVDNNIPAQWHVIKPFATIAIAFTIIFLVDWIIGSELKNFLARFDASQLNKKLESEFKNAVGELNQAQGAGRKAAFDRVQDKYLAHVKLLTYIKIAMLVILYVVEIASAIYSISFYGEDSSILSYIAPLLGVLLSGLSGLYRALKIEIPEQRHKLSHSYLGIAEEISHDQLIADIQFANAVTEIFLRKGMVNRDDIDKVRNGMRQGSAEIGLNQELYRINDDYHDRTVALNDNHRQDIAALEDREQQRIMSDRSVQDPVIHEHSFKLHKNRLYRKHCTDLIRLIQEVQQNLKRVYRQYRCVSHIYDQFQQELAEELSDHELQLDRLTLDWETLTHRPPKSSPLPDHAPHDDDDDRHDQPYNYS